MKYRMPRELGYLEGVLCYYPVHLFYKLYVAAAPRERAVFYPRMRMHACTQSAVVAYEGLVRLRPRFCGKIDALGQNPSQLGPERQGGGGATAYVARPHAPDGAPTVGAA